MTFSLPSRLPMLTALITGMPVMAFTVCEALQQPLSTNVMSHIHAPLVHT
ncbi:hypothetical protein PEC301879_19900 [Pectobacterium carotovorum subsp. carotovorum]|nr:hypothetical protein PEC301879_19900 [Pectobacterium carotovorum subsp. carotovorum]